ncbi:hypothetical protein GW17_00043688 [Ensete ventricosum]|nr:hypothetical protein GW17_00043688 [Ensete ventricosum]
MGLITHNMIYVCIDASPCPVIVDLVIIGSVGSSHHHMIILFPKGCPNPSFPLCTVVAVAATAPAKAVAALAYWQSPYQGAATPAAGVAAPADYRTGRGWQPLAGTLQSARRRRWPPFRAGPGHNQPSPCRGPWPRGWLALHRGCPWLAAPPPRYLRCENIARTRRTILRGTISSHVV